MDNDFDLRHSGAPLQVSRSAQGAVPLFIMYVAFHHNGQAAMRNLAIMIFAYWRISKPYPGSKNRPKKHPLELTSRSAVLTSRKENALNLGAREEHRKGRSGLVFGRGRTA
ncbi:uncharacterized protein CLUP02_05614 [Colletotrichum lupini]|uniref:Uncharacterized protein n=1 Tax=Colletotrichum lupini TaxID=145971 RepID=A0A9Q8SPD1_9PEZI|nr:uncharacterized protein CLUP02_05614 [Colletotrichum lupini]UQC80132.1 hypothetical protein CLUP02_05614 [Colletotrichum lupini]